MLVSLQRDDANRGRPEMIVSLQWRWISRSCRWSMYHVSGSVNNPPLLDTLMWRLLMCRCVRCELFGLYPRVTSISLKQW